MDTKEHTRRQHRFLKLFAGATLLAASVAIATPAATSAALAQTHRHSHASAGPDLVCTLFFCPPAYLQ